jgi:carbon-monoxide dehydrogenase small subunit
MLATAFLRDHPSPSDEEIREAMASNLCRCTGYQNILRAVRLAADAVADPSTEP